MTVKRFLEILLDAMSQLFFSLSVSMGIMITYGSYVKNDVNLNKATNQIEIFDTGVAFLAGMMIIPAVFVFLGKDGMASGRVWYSFHFQRCLMPWVYSGVRLRSLSF